MNMIDAVDAELAKIQADMGGLKTTGEPHQYGTGAKRDSRVGKARFDLLPITALERVAKHYALGAEKYGEDNWRKGMPRADLLASAVRHVLYLKRGDDDEDHAAAAVWNLLGYIETCELGLDQVIPPGTKWSTPVLPPKVDGGPF